MSVNRKFGSFDPNEALKYLSVTSVINLTKALNADRLEKEEHKAKMDRLESNKRKAEFDDNELEDHPNKKLKIEDEIFEQILSKINESDTIEEIDIAPLGENINLDDAA